LNKSFDYNIDEIRESRLISFQDDISDSYTVSNWKGTSLVVTTLPKTQNIPKNNLLKGLQEVRIPLALGVAKTELSAFEKALNAFYEAADFVLSAFGKSVEIATIQSRVNLLKISQPFFNTPKVLKMKGSKLDPNHRDGLSALYLWNTYLNYDSFVQNNFKRQRKRFNDVLIPFSYSDYKEVLKNSYFTTDEGKRGKFTSLEWIIEGDTAQVSYWVEEVYTKNLEESLLEVE